jgi:hypothetical protein
MLEKWGVALITPRSDGRPLSPGGPVCGHTPVGLATARGAWRRWLAAGVLGTAATWVASTSSRVAGREAQTPRLVGACERQARVFLGCALRCWANRQ